MWSCIGLRLLDTLSLRTRTGQMASASSAGGQMQDGGKPLRVFSTFQVRSTSISGDGTIRIEGLQAQSKPVDLKLDTDLDVKEGQKLVVGRMGISPAQALFLVLTARVAQ